MNKLIEKIIKLDDEWSYYEVCKPNKTSHILSYITHDKCKRMRQVLFEDQSGVSGSRRSFFMLCVLCNQKIPEETIKKARVLILMRTI